MENSKKKKCLSINNPEFSREKIVLTIINNPTKRKQTTLATLKHCICSMSECLGLQALLTIAFPPQPHLQAGRQLVGVTPANKPPKSGIRTELHKKENVMQIMMEYMKIIQRMLSTSFSDSCQNILPSSFLTHHF